MIERQETQEVDYTTSSTTPVTTSLDVILKPGSFGEYVAYGISQVGSPPVFGLVAFILVATSLTLSQAWPWLSLFIIMGMLTPMGFILWQLRRGQITGLDIHLREQRKKSMLVAIASFAIAWIAMIIGQAPLKLTLMAGIGTLQWIIIFAITLRWKISVHSTSATGMTLLILHIVGLSAAPLVITIPLVAWSRVKLRHHTPAQTIAGAALGIAVFIAAIIISSVF